MQQTSHVGKCARNNASSWHPVSAKRDGQIAPPVL